MSSKAIVLDANILIRAVLGKRVRGLLLHSAASVQFFSPDVAYDDARTHLPALLQKRSVRGDAAMAVLDSLQAIVRPIAFEHRTAHKDLIPDVRRSRMKCKESRELTFGLAGNSRLTLLPETREQ